jgi:lipopolysaccharide/colanic/teichoic acid biosynthesis glycosyltransferase
VVPESWTTVKRVTDIVVAGVALVVSLPLLSLAAVAVTISVKGSPLLLQERVGAHGRRFRMYELLTTEPGAPEHDGSALTQVGRILRRFGIDELPNLVNVLAGDMSIVGPRPPLPGEVESYDDFALRRLRVKPGMTCLWQLSGRSTRDFGRWMELDNDYVDSWTPAGDLKLMAATIRSVFFGAKSS